MEKIINPCKCEVYNRYIPTDRLGRPLSSKKYTHMTDAYAKIRYDGKRLSISGVIGPIHSGNCKGSAGQCVEEIRKGSPTKEWNREMLDKFCDIWERWHLNDMNSCCVHQRELGWLEAAKEPVTLYHYRLKREVYIAANKAKNAAISALKNGKIFVPTEEQTLLASLPYSMDVYSPLDEKMALYYEPKRQLYPGDSGATEEKTRGWVKFSESDLGILCKPCPVCGYQYGTAWQIEEVPQEIIDWLFALPDTKNRPAWV